jgi:acyl-coenzyme A synthetase/AMP-(fatty) acid ligase
MLIKPDQKLVDGFYVKDYEKLYKESVENPEAFWEKIAKELFWFKPWVKVLDWKFPYARWFVGGQTNIVANALDRHLNTPTRHKIALIWQGQPTAEEKAKGLEGPVKQYSYLQLNDEVCRFANTLKSLGLKRGDHVSIYLPRIPEQDIAMLACAKIGLVHSVVFSGFSIDALKNRVMDAQSKAVICTNSYPYKEKVVDSKKNVDEAVKGISHVKNVIVVKRLEKETPMQKGRDIWWHEITSKQNTVCSTEVMEATDPLYILYTSGCCHKDTLIQLATGEIKKISNLVEKGGSKVINVNTETLKHEQEEISERHKYPDEPELLKIKTSLSYGLFTKNHPFFVLNGDGEIIEKKASLLNIGDHIMAATKFNIDAEDQSLPASTINYHQEKCNKKSPANIPCLPMNITPEFAQLLGYYLGDGDLKTGCISVTDKDKNNLEFYKNLVEKINLRAYIKTYDRQRLIIHSRYLALYFKQNFPEVFAKSRERDIPLIIQKSSDKVVAAFIRGLYDAEGSITIKSPAIKIVSTSKILIQKLQLLLLRFGIVTSFNEELRKTHFGEKHYKTNVYELRITDRESYYHFQSHINFSSNKKRTKLQQLLEKMKTVKPRTNIHFLPINFLLRTLRNTICLNKRQLRKVFGDSYIYSKRRIFKQRLPEIIDYLKNLFYEIEKIELNNIQGIRKIINILKIKNTELVKVSGKSKHTVHQYIHANKLIVSQKSRSVFYQQIKPYLKKIRQDKLGIISDILKKIEKLNRLTDVGFFEIKKISFTQNNDNYVYDLTVENNHNYIANGFVVHNSTGKPKGVVHSHGGYMVGTYITLKWIFNITPEDVYFCTADAGWVTGHSYIVYSPLINSATTFIYEGTPDYPDPGIWWKLVEKYKINILYTAPTAVRALMRLGEEFPNKYDLSSLKILGSVGEPINPEAWLWFYKNIGREKCPIMDTWWQTETGMHILSPLPSVPLKPGSCFKPFFGIEADVVDEKGNKVPVNTQGYLIIKKPWPAMLLDVYNNPTRYKETYFEKIPNVYFAGDSAKIDEDGYYWITGRNDDVIKVAGHRLGSAELESAFVSNPKVAEAAVIGKPHEIKGESIKAFVILKQGVEPTDELKKELVQTVRKSIGPIATPDEIDFVDKLPKTRSGKIMRRVLKAQELGLPVGDISTLES